MREINWTWIIVIVGLVGFAVYRVNGRSLTAPTGTLATPRADLIATSQADTYHRDAQATTNARQLEAVALTATFEADMRNIQATETAVVGTAVAESKASLATAVAQQTRDALAYQMTVDVATAQAQQTAVYATTQANETATHQAMISAQATATREYDLLIMSQQGTRQALELRREETAVKREAWLMQTASVLSVLFFGVLAVGLLFLAYRLIPLIVNRLGLVRFGEQNLPLFLLQRGENTVLVNPLTMTQPSALIGSGGDVTMPELTSGQNQQQTALAFLQLLHTMMHKPQPTEQTRTLQIGAVSQSTTTRTLSLSKGAGQTRDFEGVRQAHPPLSAHFVPPPIIAPQDAPLSALRNWDKQGGLPLGIYQEGLLIADPDRYPHFLMAGTSGSGKTRFGLWTLTLSALLAGWQVIILDRSGLDFIPFEGHPNARTLLLDPPERAIQYLHLTYLELQTRLRQLREARVSTWSRLGKPHTLIVLDEFANLADSMDNKGRDQLWQYARMIAAEGRKAGIHLAIALQDPTHKSLDLRIRRNCLPISFRVKDESASRVVLGTSGAEGLHQRQFLTVMQSLHKGLAFAPSEDEIQEFLELSQVNLLPIPEWIEAQQSDTEPTFRQAQCAEENGSDIGLLNVPETAVSDKVKALAEQIAPLWQEMVAEGEINKTELARSIGKTNAGYWSRMLDEAINYLESCQTPPP